MSPRPVHTGIHHFGLAHDGISTCEVCGFSLAATIGHQCSGIRNILGRPTITDLSGSLSDDTQASQVQRASMAGETPHAMRTKASATGSASARGASRPTAARSGLRSQDLPDRGIASEPRLEGIADSSAMSGPLANGSPLLAVAPRSGKKRRGISPASPEQRAHVKAKACIVTGDDSLVHPAHLIPRSLLTIGQDDPRAVVPLRPDIHRLYDDEAGYDLLPHLEPHFRVELGYAVERFGLLRTLEVVTGQRWAPAGEPA